MRKRERVKEREREKEDKKSEPSFHQLSFDQLERKLLLDSSKIEKNGERKKNDFSLFQSFLIFYRISSARLGPTTNKLLTTRNFAIPL